MYIRILLLSLLQGSYQLDRSWSVETPSVSYSMRPRDFPGDYRKRKQNARFQESIRLKPPPPDWPSPTMGAADFLYDLPEVTSLSPLQAYQAKLQEAYLRDLEEQSHKKPTKPTPKVKEDESVWSNLDEDFKKLLDPNELLKLNKKLAPILNTQSKIASKLKKGLVDATEKPATAVTSPGEGKKKRIRTTLAQTVEIGNKANSGERKSSVEQQKPRIKKLKKKKSVKQSVEEKFKNKKRKVKTRKFAFDIHRSVEDEKEVSLKDKDFASREKSRVSVLKESSDKSTSSSESSDSYEKELHPTTKRILSTTSETQETSKFQTTLTTPHWTASTVTSTASTPSHNMTTKTYENVTTISSRRKEAREKRKQIEKEMEKVLEGDGLEGSSDDRDSKWTTSETPRFPIINVTPHEALLGILKQKIISFVDDVIKSKQKL